MNENQNNNVMMGNYGPNNYQQKNNNISITNNEIDKERDEREIINEEDIDNLSESEEDCDEDIYECDTSEYFDIIFKSDGTYIFQSGSYATMPTAGKYKKEGNKITLIPVVEYGSDACYYNINESNKIILNLTSEGIEFNNVVLVLTDIKIDNNYLSRYVVNPINGKIPEGWEEEWIDCTAEY